MFCSFCGKELPEDTIICAYCNHNLASITPQQSPAQPYQMPIYTDPDSVQATNGMAIAAFVVSIVGMFFMLSIVGLILGIIARNQIKSSNGSQKGSGLAIAAIVISCLWMIIPLIVLISGFAGMFGNPAFNPTHAPSTNTRCLSNLKQLSNGIMMYIQDYDQRMPPAARWSDGIMPYIKNNSAFVCPEARTLPCGYSFYENLDGASLKKIAKPSDTPVLFDSLGGWNSALSIDTVVFRHNGGYNCSFVDGHVKWMNPVGGPSGAKPTTP